MVRGLAVQRWRLYRGGYLCGRWGDFGGEAEYPEVRQAAKEIGGVLYFYYFFLYLLLLCIRC